MQTFKCLALLFGVLLAAACARSVEKNDAVGNGSEIDDALVSSKSKSDNGKEIDYFKLLSKQKVGDVRGVIQKGVEGLRGDLEEFVVKNNLGKVDGLKWKAFNATIEKRLSVLKQNDENSWRDFVSDFRAAYKEFIQDVSHSGEIKKENNAQTFLEKGFISIIGEIEKLLSSTDGPLKTFLSFIHREATTPAADTQNASTPGIFVGIGLTVNQILRPNEGGNIQYDVATSNNQTASGGIFQQFGQAVNHIFRPANGVQNDTNVLQNNVGQNGPIQTQPPGGVLQAFGHAVNNILRPGNNSRVNSTSIQNDNSVTNNQTQIPNNVGVLQALGHAVSNIFRPPTGNFAQLSQNDTQNITNIQNDGPTSTTHRPNKRRKPKPPQQEDSVQTTEKPYVIQILNVYTDPNTAQNLIRPPQSDENQEQNKMQSLNIVLHLVYDKLNKTVDDANVSLSSQPQGSNKDVVANVNTKPGEPVNIYLDFGSILSELIQKNSSGNKPLQTPYISVISKPMEKPSVQNNANSVQSDKKPVASQEVAQNDQPQANPESILQNYSVQQPNGANSSLHILVIQTPKQRHT